MDVATESACAQKATTNRNLQGVLNAKWLSTADVNARPMIGRSDTNKFARRLLVNGR